MLDIYLHFSTVVANQRQAYLYVAESSPRHFSRLQDTFGTNGSLRMFGKGECTEDVWMGSAHSARIDVPCEIDFVECNSIASTGVHTYYARQTKRTVRSNWYSSIKHLDA